jgi:hypothetical protein
MNYKITTRQVRPYGTIGYRGVIVERTNNDPSKVIWEGDVFNNEIDASNDAKTELQRMVQLNTVIHTKV